MDAFVDKIVVHKVYFEWHLFFDDTTMMKVAIEGNKRIMIYQSMSGDASVGLATFTMNGGTLTNNR